MVDETINDNDMKKWFLFLVAILGLTSCDKNTQRAISDERLSEVFTMAEHQYVMLDQQLTDSTMPRTLNADGTLRTSDLNGGAAGSSLAACGISTSSAIRKRSAPWP